MGGKQTDRKAKRSSKIAEDDADPEPTVSDGNSFIELFKVLFLGSSIMAVAPKLQSIMTDDSKEKAPVKKEKAAPTGLASPATAEESIDAWMDLKTLELDWGPRPKRNQSPGLNRIKVNFFNNMPQYFHILLALMMVRAFLFRSFFACLPWLVGYQFLSLWVPLDGIPQLPQVPVDKCPFKFRVAASVGIHALVWFFFVYEVLWSMRFYEKGVIIGLLCYHAYAVRPADKAKAAAN